MIATETTIEKTVWNRLFSPENDHLFTAEAAHAAFASVRPRGAGAEEIQGTADL